MQSGLLLVQLRPCRLVRDARPWPRPRRRSTARARTGARPPARARAPEGRRRCPGVRRGGDDVRLRRPRRLPNIPAYFRPRAQRIRDWPPARARVLDGHRETTLDMAALCGDPRLPAVCRQFIHARELHQTPAVLKWSSLTDDHRGDSLARRALPDTASGFFEPPPGWKAPPQDQVIALE